MQSQLFCTSASSFCKHKHTDTATARPWQAVPGEEGDFIPHAPGLGVCVLDIENRISAVAVWQLLEKVGVSGILITGL